MLHLYNLDKVKIRGLKLYKDYCIESVLSSGDKTLSFLYPSRLTKEIKEEGYIRTKTDEFVIKEISTNGEWNSIKARLNVDELEGKPWEHFDTTEQTIEQCLNLALAGTGWTVQVNNVTKKRTIRKTNCSSWDIIQQAKKTYLVEIEFDTINKIIKVAEKLGNDKGVYFMDSLNLRDLDIQSNSYDFYTRIIAIGKDDLKVTVENFQYSTKKKTLIWKDERYTSLTDLTEDATKKLEEISKPYRSYSADVIDLANTSNKYSILSYSLGDSIYLISKDKGIKEKQRIIKITKYPEEPHRNTCEIANSMLSFADIQKEYNDNVDTVNNITSDNGTISEGAIKTAVEHLTIKKLDVGSLNAVEIRVGNLEATSATITQLKAVNADIANLRANKAEIGDLTAAVGRVGILESSVGDIKTLVNGNLTSNNIQSLMLTSDKVTVANGFIKNAMIENLDVAKVNAGDISVNKFRIKSDSGNLLISDNTIQIKDNTRVRVQIGKDASNDYNMYVWDSSGKLMFDAAGLKPDGIKSKIIRDDMITDNANINGSKINISSLVTEVNKDTNTTLMKASKVALDTTGQSLEVSFNSLKSNVDNMEIGGRNYVKKLGGDTYDINSIYGVDRSYSAFETINSKKWLKYLGNTGLRIDSILIQPNITYTWSFNVYTTGEDKDITCAEWDGTSYNLKRYSISTTPTKISHTFTSKETSSYEILHIQSLLSTTTYYFSDFKLERGNKSTDWTPAPEDVEQKIETNATAINIQQGKIDTLISNTTITKDGQTIQLKDSYNSTVATVDSINSTIGKHTSTIDALTGQITGVDTKVNAVERDLSGVKTSVSNATTTANSALSKATEAKQTADGFTQRVSNIETNYATTAAMNSAISQSASGIKSEVSNTFVSKADASLTYATKASMELTDKQLRLDFSGSGGYNLVRNGIFNNELNHWSLWGNCTMAVENSTSGYGKSLKIVTTGSNQGIYQNISDLEVGKDYILSTYINTSSGRGVIQVNNGGEWGAAVSSGTGWQWLTVNFKAKSPNIIIYIGNSISGTPGTYWFTACMLTRGTVRLPFSPNANEIYSGNTIIDSTGVTIYNGALTIMDKWNNKVLTANNDGDLSLIGNITTYSADRKKKQLDILKNNISFYDWETQEYSPYIGSIYTAKQIVNGNYISTPSITIENSNESFIAVKSLKGYLMHFDHYNRSTYSTHIPIWFYQSSIMGIGASMYFSMPSNEGRIFGGSADTLVVEVPTTKKDAGFIVQSLTGTPLINTRAGYDYINHLKDTYIDGKFAVSGSKNSIQKTKNYGDRLINAYETAEYYYGDLGFGIINEDGECLMALDDIFLECVNTKQAYHVFTQAYNGKIESIERYETYIMIRGIPKTEFSWQAMAKRLGYENHRLETPNDFDKTENYENMFDRHFEEFEAEKTTEKESIEGDMYTNDTISSDMLTHELDFKLDDFLLNEEEIA